MKNLAIIFLSSLAISATLPTNSPSNTADKVFCQKLNAKEYDKNDQLKWEANYNYNGKQLISINGINTFCKDKIFTYEDDFNRYFEWEGFDKDYPSKNHQTLNEFGQIVFSEFWITNNGQPISLNVFSEYEEVVNPKTGKIFCRLTSELTELETIIPPSTTTYEYNDKGQLVKIISDRGIKNIEYIAENKRKVPMYNNGSYKIETVDDYGNVLVTEDYDAEGNYEGKTVYTYLIQ